MQCTVSQELLVESKQTHCTASAGSQEERRLSAGSVVVRKNYKRYLGIANTGHPGLLQKPHVQIMDWSV